MHRSLQSVMAELREMLHERGVHRASVRWVFRADVALSGGSLVVRPVPLDRDGVVEQTYKDATASDLPLGITAVGIDEDAVYCTLIVPASADEAERRMIAGSKLSVLVPLFSVQSASDDDWQRRSRSQTPEQATFLDDMFPT